MAADQVGIVYYADDPQKRVFRIVYPSDPAHLDGPALENEHPANRLRVMVDEKGQPHGWHTFATKPEHNPVFVKIPKEDLNKWTHGGIVHIEAELAAAKAAP